MYFGIFKQLREINLPHTHDSNLYEGFFSQFYEQISLGNGYDVPFILQHAMEKAKQGRILELACGTGRLMFQLAEKGFQITGLDLSDDMLKICHDSRNKSMALLKSRTTIIKGDMTDFHISHKFPLIVLSATSICLLETKEQVNQLFASVYEHLEVGGRFIFDYVSNNSRHNLDIRNDKVVVVPTISQKGFVMLGEHMDESSHTAYLNLYGEVASEERTLRYFGYSKKTFLPEEIIQQIISNYSFIQVDEHRCLQEGEGEIKAIALQKV